MICPSCCGEYRLVEISCPSDCAYLRSNEPYQRRRLVSKAPREWVDRLMRYERGGEAPLQILHIVQLAVCHYAADHADFDRASAVEGMEFARRRMSLIETPEPYVPPFGEFLVKRLDQLIKDRAPVEREGVRELLDETVRHVEREVPADGFPEFIRFLRALYADEFAGKPEGGSGLILPG
jgi:hypothetical protein